MSINWHHFKTIQSKIGPLKNTNPHQQFTKGKFNREHSDWQKAQLWPKNPSGTQKDLKVFNKYMSDERKRPQTGRAWKAEELRLKSNDDLHKLWYVFLIEKNKLKSDRLIATQLGQEFYGDVSHNLLKMQQSMSRLLTVVNERKKIRNEYRKFLEDEYIAMKKKQEMEQFKKDQARRKSKNKSFQMTPKETAKLLAGRSNKLERKYNNIREDLVTKFNESDPSEAAERLEEDGNVSKKVRIRSPTLTETDMKIVAQQKIKLSQRDILKRHVSNYSELDLKQRRKVMAHIQSQRAMHAKEVFLKELSAIGSMRRTNVDKEL